MSLSRWLSDPYPFATRVLLHTKDDRTFRGVLWEERRGLLVLKHVELLEARGTVRPVDGDVLVERKNAAFLQVIGPDAA